MAILTTGISNLVPSEKIMANRVNALLDAKNELVNSGIAVRGPEANEVANGGSRKGSLAFINPLAVSTLNVGNDDLTDAGEVGRMTASEFDVLRHDLNLAYGTADLARMVTQYDAQGGIAAGLAMAWNTVYNDMAAYAMAGCLGADAGLTIGNGSAALSLDLIIDAAASAEMYADLFDTIIVSPVTKAKLQKLNAGNTFVQKSETNIGFDTFGGYKILVSKKFGDTDTILCRSGALVIGEGAPAGRVPLEIERVANGGNGQGGDILHSRRSVVIHPQGFDYVGATGIAPSALGTASNWDLAVSLDMIGFRKIDHT